MRFEEWESYYKAIVQSMGYDRDRDEVVAYQLSSMLEERQDHLVPPEELRGMIKGKHVFISPASSSGACGWLLTAPPRS